MQDDHNPASAEIVSRILVRDDDLDSIDRSTRDEDDFIRKRVYGRTRRPENGLSLFRRRIPNQQIYEKLCIRRKNGNIVFIPMYLSLASTTSQKLVDAEFKIHTVPVNPEHISLRCPDCDMSDIVDPGSTCAPKEGSCPFFERTDPMGLVELFTDDISPGLRTQT